MHDGLVQSVPGKEGTQKRRIAYFFERCKSQEILDGAFNGSGMRYHFKITGMCCVMGG